MHKCGVTVKYGSEKEGEEKNQDDGENEKELKNFDSSWRFSATPQRLSLQNEQERPEGNQRHFKFNTTAPRRLRGLKVPL